MKNRETDEWLAQNERSTRNFIRKWGQMVEHDEYLKPIITPKYDIGFIPKGKCNSLLLRALEPYCNNLYLNDKELVKDYIKSEQPNTDFDLNNRLMSSNVDNDILVTFDSELINQQNFHYLTQLPKIIQDSDGNYQYTDGALTEQSPSNTSENFKAVTPTNYQLYYINYSSDIEISTEGRRYRLDPEHAQINGSYFIDNSRGLIKFGSALAGETITLHYISDSLGTDNEMVVHKFCEEACYKWIAYGILSTRSNTPPFIISRFKKEKFAETRKAKIRLSNIKMEEFTQVLKGLGKQIK